MAALIKKNTLKKTGFQVTDLGFDYRNKSYKFDDVIGLGIIRHVLEHKVILVGSEFHHSISIVIQVESGDHIQVTEQPTWLSDSKLSSVELIERQFSTIAQKSWNNRLNRYINQLENEGYYEYGGWRFYPQQKKIKQIKNNKTYDINSIKLAKTATYIIVKEKNESIASKVFKNIAGKEVIISTLYDPDVFFALLDHFFNIRWNN